MDLKTWFKGLAVFVASSLITSVAANQLDPSVFNFSKAGLAKIASLAALIGAKAVFLYMKQSPLPGTNPAADWTKVTRVVAFVLLLPMLAGTAGCYNSWERSTYATLAVGKSVIDCAVAGYNHFDADIRHACAADPDDPAFDPAGFYLPQTREAQQAIEKAREVQTACVEAFAGYAVAKVAKDRSATIAEKQAQVISYLSQLPALLDALRKLHPGSTRSAGVEGQRGANAPAAPPSAGSLADAAQGARVLAPSTGVLAAPQEATAVLQTEVRLGQ